MGHVRAFDRLLADARDGDITAWESIVRTYAPRLAAYARSQGANDPDDLVSIVFVRIVRDIDRFSGVEREFEAWVFRIAQHRLIDERRRRGRSREDSVEQPPEPADEDVADVVERRDSERRLHRHLAALPAQQRSVIFLRYVLDMSHRDIAAVLDTSVGAVKMLQRRGLEALRPHLESR